MPQYFTRSEVAEILKVRPKTVSTMIVDGRLKPDFWIGRRPRFSAETIAALAHESTDAT